MDAQSPSTRTKPNRMNQTSFSHLCASHRSASRWPQRRSLWLRSVIKYRDHRHIGLVSSSHTIDLISSTATKVSTKTNKNTRVSMCHVDIGTIAREANFDLDGQATAARRIAKNPRMNAKSFAIICWTDVSSKDTVEHDDARLFPASLEEKSHRPRPSLIFMSKSCWAAPRIGAVGSWTNISVRICFSFQRTKSMLANCPFPFLTE